MTGLRGTATVTSQIERYCAAKRGDEVIGGIGAAGAAGAKLDHDCAHAGLDKIRDRLQ